MLSLALTLSLVVFWTVLGRALLAAVGVRVGVLRAWLLAPGVGLSVMVLGLMVGSQAGLPIRLFSWPLGIVLAAGSAAVLIWRRPLLPWRSMVPFALAIVGSALWTEWPAFKLGFNWISFVTDDFANYCLSAERFKNFGFYHAPSLADLAGRDYTQYFWFMHVLSLIRFGAEHQLAWVSSIVGKRMTFVFMPTIIALGLVQVAGIGALVLHSGRWRRQAQWTAVLLAISPMFFYGDLCQVLAQAGGLGLMLTSLAFLTAHLAGRSRLRMLVHAVPTAVTGAALAVFYPEVSPFVVLALGLYVAITWARSRRFPGARVVMLEYAILGILILLRHNLISFLYTLANQFADTLRHIDLSLSLFPFFLIPSGMSALFGFQPINFDIPDPAGSALVAIGMALLLCTLAAALWQASKPLPTACLLVVQFGLTLKLFRDGSDFGLFKMAMFMQPALQASLAAILVSTRRRWVPPAAVLVLFALTVQTALVYTRSSAGLDAGVLTEMKWTSDNLSRTPPVPPQGALVVSGIDNIVAEKLAAGIYRGTDEVFLSHDVYSIISSLLLNSDWPLMGLYPHRDLYPLGHKLLRDRERVLFSGHTLFDTRFIIPRMDRMPSFYLEQPVLRSLFNKLHPDASGGAGLFTLTPVDSVRNQLVFIHSTLGNHYYLGNRSIISFFQQEPDYFDGSVMVNGIGRFFLLRVENPTDSLFLRISATKTLMRPGHNVWSPNAAILGEQRVPLNLTSGGAINRFIGPVHPVRLDGASYIALDFGEPAAPFPSHRSGLKALYNGDISLDYRRLIGFGRDISALSPEEFAAIPRPRKVSNFPPDIENATGFEYVGIYEDAWLSPDVDLVMGEARPGETLRVRAYLPQQHDGHTRSGEVIVSVNGGRSWRFATSPGRLEWVLPVDKPGLTTRIRLRFSASGRLPSGDARPVSARLESLEIVPAEPIDFSTIGSARPPAAGIDQDGWTEQSADLDLAMSPASAAVELIVDFPGWPKIAKTNELTISVDGETPSVHSLKPGRNVVMLPVSPGACVRRLHLEASQSFLLPAPDGRQRAYRMLSAAAADRPTP